MTGWFSQHGVELAAFVFTLFVTIVGWILEHKSSKEQDRKRKEDIKLLRERIDASNAAVAALRDQVRALESQADALQRQAAIQEDEASVANNNPFDARDVRVELSDGKEYELGDISRGSEASFLFLERGMWAGSESDVRITWALPDDPSHRFFVTKPVPPYHQS